MNRNLFRSRAIPGERREIYFLWPGLFNGRLKKLLYVWVFRNDFKLNVA